MMRRVATLRIKHYGKYLLSVIDDSGESIKNHRYLLEFEAKLKRPSDTE
jgi:hypothetical protein